MLEVFLKTLPFFAIIAIGFAAAKSGFFNAEATAYLTKFIFFFALSAMLFRFAANLKISEVYNPRLLAGYLWGTAVVYLLATGVAIWRRLDIPTTAVEAQCSVIANSGFLGLPMFVLLFGDAAVGPVMMTLTVDLVVFSSLIVILINGARGGRLNLIMLGGVGLGLIKNPMILSISLGLAWSALALPIPNVLNDFLTILGGAATPGALFAIGASLAVKSAERLEVAGWLAFAKLIMHPLFVAIGVILLFPIDRFSAIVVVSTAALPVAGNIFMLAQHYGIAVQRVSTAILLSTAASIITVPMVIAWVSAH